MINSLNNNDMAPHYYYKYAQENIECVCSECFCPSQNASRYSFVYVDEKQKLIYFNVPKCASSSLRDLFFNSDNSYSMKNPEQNLEQYFKFSFVRNPWHRMVSNWKMFTTKQGRIKQLKAMTNKDMAHFMEFENFVRFAKENKNHHWQPQFLYHPEDLDFIGKLETIDDDLNHIFDHLGKERTQVKHLNKTNTKADDSTSYTRYYTPSLIDLVGNMYAEDVKRFGYEFG